jgi:hypothetical protein
MLRCGCDDEEGWLVGALLEHHYAGVPWPPLLRVVLLESYEMWIAEDISSDDPGNVGLDFAGVVVI